MTTLTEAAVSVRCPLGCKRTVAAQVKEIHYCVIDGWREYVGTHDGEFVCCAATNGQVENLLDDYVLSLCEQGLIDEPLAALADDPPPADDDSEAVNWNSRCRNCDGAHHIQRCPEIWAALHADPDDEPQPWPDRAISTAPAIVRKAIITWHRERTTCALWLSLFSDADRTRLAASVIAYRKQFYAASELTVERLVAVWDRAIADLLPPRPAAAMAAYRLTRTQLAKALDGAIEMFLEFQYQHGYGEMEARQLAADEVIAGLDADRELAAHDPTERLRLQLAA